MGSASDSCIFFSIFIPSMVISSVMQLQHFSELLFQFLTARIT